MTGAHTDVTAHEAAVRVASGRRRRVLARVLGAVELAVGGIALVSGVLLAGVPDGALLGADTSALEGSPFADWRLPGVLLASFVGVGFLAVGGLQWRDARHARWLSAAAGVGLVGFEAVEFAWLGFWPLQAVMAAVGVAIVVLAAVPSPRAHARRPGTGT